MYVQLGEADEMEHLDAAVTAQRWTNKAKCDPGIKTQTFFVGVPPTVHTLNSLPGPCARSRRLVDIGLDIYNFYYGSTSVHGTRSGLFPPLRRIHECCYCSAKHPL